MSSSRVLTSEIPRYFHSSYKDFEVLRFGTHRYLMVDGTGDPNVGTHFGDAVSVLYQAAYSVKFSLQRSNIVSYRIPPLEALWWADDMSAFAHGRKDEWQWTVMSMLPDSIPLRDIKTSLQSASEKRNPPDLSRVRIERYSDGKSVQIAFRGPYSDSGFTLGRLHAEFLPSQQLAPTGKYHEIYLNDARRTKPENLRTILRQPVESAKKS